MANILVVEDEPDQRKMLVKRLASDGHQVVAAEDGESGLREIEKEVPDLVILDVMMPGMDGWEVCRRLRTSPETKNIFIIITTARAGTMSKLISGSMGANVYLEKPCDPKELLLAVNDLVSKDRKTKA